jgi:SAM-dependent methyltransferase
MSGVKRLAGLILPGWALNQLKAYRKRHPPSPPPGDVFFGALRRVTPVSRNWGYDRGLPIDRYYIERFLAANAADIHGRVLEVKNNVYTRTFGGSHVTVSDVLNLTEGNPEATIVGDLATAREIPSDTFDCIILTQTLQLIFDLRAALMTVYRILRPGGALLLTVPGISQIARDDRESWEDCWRFTTYSVQRLLEQFFPDTGVTTGSRGNVLASIAFLEGVAAGELTEAELDHQDLEYQMLITARAVKG